MEKKAQDGVVYCRLPMLLEELKATRKKTAAVATAVAVAAAAAKLLLKKLKLRKQ